MRCCSSVILIVWSLLALSCHSQQTETLTPRSTDLIVCLDEWNLTGGGISSPAHPDDTLTYLKLAGTYYRVETATSSTFVYDNQRRLIEQTTNGHRNYFDYGPAFSSRRYTYSYGPNQLTVVREGKRFSGPFEYDNAPAQQTIPLTDQGLLMGPVRFDDTYVIGDNIYSGISRLLAPSFGLKPNDFPRSYDTEGYVVEVKSPDSQQILVQTITAGNVVDSRVKSFGQSTTDSPPLIRWLNQYDESRPTIPNPHQFLGSTSRNLISKSIQYNLNQNTPFSQRYQYEYDATGRVVQYQIRSEMGTTGTLQTVGIVTYRD